MNTQMYEVSNMAFPYNNLADKLTAKNITNIPANGQRNLFLFGTNSMKHQNEIHLLEFDEEQSKVYCCEIFTHPGVVHKIFSNPSNELLFFTSFSECKNVENIEFAPFIFAQLAKETNKVGICSFGSGLGQPNQVKNVSKRPVSLIHEISNANRVHSVVKIPEEKNILICDEAQIKKYDMEKNISTVIAEAEPNSEFSFADIDPHHPNLIATVDENNISLYDIRDHKAKFRISAGHKLRIFDVDFNPNKQYYILSAGEDCLIKFWEIRKPGLPVKTVEDLQNCILSCKYNRYHDQLILSSCDDGSVNLHKMISTSSAPLLSKVETSGSKKNKDEDGLIKCYDEHEDSVYAVSWSAGSAWVFSSISYTGNVIVNLVPQAEKYRILL